MPLEQNKTNLRLDFHDCGEMEWRRSGKKQIRILNIIKGYGSWWLCSGLQQKVHSQVYGKPSLHDPFTSSTITCNAQSARLTPPPTLQLFPYTYSWVQWQEQAPIERVLSKYLTRVYVQGRNYKRAVVLSSAKQKRCF